MYSLETRGLSHAFPGGDGALRDVDLRVPKGSIYGLLGPNGAGKSTLLRLALGLLRPQRGEVFAFGRAFEPQRREALGRIGALIEMPSLYEHLSAAENLEIVRLARGLPRSRIDEVLRDIGLDGVGDQRAGRFSLGMKQRLGIAAALMHRPALLILDEPSNGLDPVGLYEIRALLLRLNREEGTTVLVSSHLLADLEKWVTHLGILHRGRLRWQGALPELRSAHPGAADLEAVFLHYARQP